MKHYIIAFASLVLLNACANSSVKDSNLLWSDEFDRSAEEITAKWNIIEGNGCPELCGFGNNEQQYYSASEENLAIENGVLTIKATYNEEDSIFRSAKLTSEGKGDWQYAYIEVNALLPQGRGTWPAIWMLPTQEGALNWPRDGEIDIMEHVGYNQGTVYGTIHTEAYNHIKGTQKTDSIKLEDLSENFHVYAIDWQKDHISWYVDNELYHTIHRNNDGEEAWPFNKQFHLILNFAVGGNWGGLHGVDSTIYPQEMKIDYVRVYKNKPDKLIADLNN